MRLSKAIILKRLCQRDGRAGLPDSTNAGAWIRGRFSFGMVSAVFFKIA